MPVACDAMWPDTWPLENDPAPTLAQESTGSTSQPGCMLRVAIARHDKTVNVSFRDGHAENVKLGNLWTLKWHAQWTNTTPVNVP